MSGADSGNTRDVDVVINLHSRLGEGPRWDHRSGLLAWVDILEGFVHLTDPDDGSTTTIPVGVEVGALALHGRDGYLLAVRDGFARLADDEVETLGKVIDEPDVRMNDGGVDPAGRFLAGSMAGDLRPGRGSLYSLEPDGNVRVVFDRVTISNGLAWSEAGDTMFYVDSALQRIDAVDYDVVTGEASNRRPWVEIPPEDGTPDGITIDSEGCLWVALWGGGRVRRYSPAAQIIGEIELPVPRVTSCSFGGDSLDRLFITTAAVGRGDALEGGGLDGALFVVEPGCTGVRSTVAGHGGSQ